MSNGKKISNFGEAFSANDNQEFIINNLGVTNKIKWNALKANLILSGSGAPSSTPYFVGQKYIDTQNYNTYTAYGTSSSADWIPEKVIGSVIAYTIETPPSGYLECNGAAISRTNYAGLFAKIGDLYGVGDGSTTFNLPDYRGKFLRGWDHGAGNDPDAATRTDAGDGTVGDHVGTKQADEFESHDHTFYWNTAANLDGSNYSGDSRDVSTNLNSSSPIGNSGGNETRPINVNVMYCIKY
jgi:microcystin-dependent protein